MSVCMQNVTRKTGQIDSAVYTCIENHSQGNSSNVAKVSCTYILNYSSFHVKSCDICSETASCCIVCVIVTLCILSYLINTLMPLIPVDCLGGWVGMVCAYMAWTL